MGTFRPMHFFFSILLNFSTELLKVVGNIPVYVRKHAILKSILPNFFLRKMKFFMIFAIKLGCFLIKKLFSYETNTQT